MLVIYPVSLKYEKKDKNGKVVIDEEKKTFVEGLPSPVIGLSIGIPRNYDILPKKFNYKINAIKYRELFDIDDDIEEEIE